MLTLRAYAKVNLTLEVLGRRSDGYHNISSVIQTVGLSDTLTFEDASTLSVHSSSPELSHEENLTYRAACLLQATIEKRVGARIHLQKGIPIAAGLGGGSSDAAATLIGLDQLWNLGLGTFRLHRLATQLGSDVPFFLYGGTALVEGKGEFLTPLPTPLGDLRVVLLRPPITISGKTKALYGALPATAYTDGARTNEMVRRLRSGQFLEGENLFNVFDTVAVEKFPGVEKFWNAFNEAQVSHVHLAGSGPTLVTLMPWRKAEMVYELLHNQGYEVYLEGMVPTFR